MSEKSFASPLFSSYSSLLRMSGSNANTLVLVTGSTGFVGTEVSLAFLKHGFSVRGTARSQGKADEWSAKHAAVADGRMSWSIVEDIATPNAFVSAIKGVQLVAHTASPFHYNVKDNEGKLFQRAQQLK